MSSQLKLLPCSNEHGGETRIGKRKIARPVAVKKVMHVVLRARASGLLSFREGIHLILSQSCQRFQVQTLERALCGNHIHLAIRASSRRGFSNFLRVATSGIAQLVTGSKKGQSLVESFWKELPFTRIVTWGKALASLLKYVIQNEAEATFRIPYQQRATRSENKQKFKLSPKKLPN